MLDFPEQPLDTLLGLDEPPEDPDAYDNYGFAVAARLSLCGHSGTAHPLGPCRVLAMHRSDDQSQALAGALDLEFETPKGPVWVDFANFVRRDWPSTPALGPWSWPCAIPTGSICSLTSRHYANNIPCTGRMEM